MNTLVKGLFIALASLAGGYLAFRTTIGKEVLQNWLIQRWRAMAKKQDRTLKVEYLQAQLQKLDYPTHELLVRITLFDVMGKISNNKLDEKAKLQGARLTDKLDANPAFKKADFSQLTGIVFPGG